MHPSAFEHGRLFFDTVPTLSAVGPIEKLAPMSDIASALSSPVIKAKAAS